jgi:hypothetical protein
MQKTSTVAPLGGDDGDPGAPTIQCKKHRWWAPSEAVTEIQERPLSMQKMSMVAPLGGSDGDPGAPTINEKNVDGTPWETMLEIWQRPPFNAKSVNGSPPGRRCRRFGSDHYSTQKMSMTAPLGGDAGDLRAPTIQHKNVNDAPLGCDARDPGASTIQRKKCRWRSP